MNVVVAPCSHDAAKYAVLNWHYSQRMPKSKLVKFGVWEDTKFVGAVIYGSGANGGLFAPYGLEQTQGCELVRVAMRKHSVFVTQVIAESINQLKKSQSGLRLLISFADPDQGHEGKIYQAGNWIYAGMTDVADEYIVNGIRTHGRALRSTRSGHKQKNVPAKNVEDWARKVLDPNIRRVSGSSKHRYLYPMDKAMRRQILKIGLGYKNAVEGLEASHLDSVEEVLVQSQPTARGKL
jgi:hypothetical protein